MKKALKITGIILGSVIVLLAVAFCAISVSKGMAARARYAQLGEKAPELLIEGQTFLDLNKNGRLDPYEDSRVGIDQRVEDLLQKMILEEKAGTMFVSMIGMTSRGEPFDKPKLSKDPFDLLISLMVPPASEMLVRKKMNHFNIINSYDPESVFADGTPPI